MELCLSNKIIQCNEHMNIMGFFYYSLTGAASGTNVSGNGLKKRKIPTPLNQDKLGHLIWHNIYN